MYPYLSSVFTCFKEMLWFNFGIKGKGSASIMIIIYTKFAGGLRC